MDGPRHEALVSSHKLHITKLVETDTPDPELDPNEAARVVSYGVEGLPYPETTGVALAAIRGVRSAQTDRSIATAQRFLAECRSADALNWLRLGLLAHGQLPAGFTPPALAFRTLIETSMDMLVAETQQGREVLWGNRS